jgi:hypothetical protein
MMQRRLALFFAVILPLAACGGEDPPASGGKGGGGGGGGGAGGSGPMGTDYFPFKEGNRWEYQVTDDNGLNHHKLNTIVRLEAVGGTGPHAAVMAYRVETLQQDATNPDGTVSWQKVEGDKVIRYRETNCKAGTIRMNGDLIASCTVNEDDFWVPYRVRLDKKPNGMELAMGLKWDESFMESKTTYSFKLDPMNPTADTSTSNPTEKWEVLQMGATVTVPAGTIKDCAVIKKTPPTLMTKTYTFCRGVGKVIEEGVGQSERLTSYTLK